MTETNVQTNEHSVENYIGLTGDTFKKRYANHKKSFTVEKYSTETTLSLYIWELKKKGSEYSVKWKIIDRAQTFSPVTGICNLCTKEKFYIIFKPELSSLNKRNELGTFCRHKRKHQLGNI